MTTIITRLYADATTAHAVAADLAARGHNPDTVDVVTRDGEGAIDARMKAAGVTAKSAAVYAGHVAEGNALLVVRAPFAPIGTARDVLKVVNRSTAIKVDLPSEDVYIRIEPKRDLGPTLVLKDHPLMLSNPFRNLPHGRIFGNLLSERKSPGKSVIRGGAFMSTKFFPMKLLSSRKDGTSVLKNGPLMSDKFGIPTLVKDWAPRDILPTKV